jgi:hypothetical protein
MMSKSASMDVDKPQGGQSTSHGKAVTIGLSVGVVSPCVFAVTPINPNPKTPRGEEIVKEIRARALGILALVVGVLYASLPELVLHAALGGAALRPSSPASRPATPSARPSSATLPAAPLTSLAHNEAGSAAAT